MRLCVCSSFYYAILYVLFSFVIILMVKRELVALLPLSSRCLVAVIVPWLFLAVSWAGLQCAIVVFPGHTHFSGRDVIYSQICFQIRF